MNATLERQVQVNPTELSPEIQLELAEIRLNSARTEWAQVSSKNRDRMVRRKIEGYNDIRDEYNSAVQEYGRLSRSDEVAAADGDREALSGIVAEYTMQEHLALRQESERFTDSKTIRKFARKFGEWMNRGNMVTKIAKGAAVSGAVAAGVAIAPAGVAVAAGVTLAARAGVSFLRGSNSQPELRDLGEGTLSSDELMSDVSPDDELFAAMQQKASDTYKVDNKEVQKKVAKATRRGLGLAAFTTVLGGTMGMAAHGMFVPSAHASDELIPHAPVGMDDATHASQVPISELNAGHGQVDLVSGHDSGLQLLTDSTTDHEPITLISGHDSGLSMIDQPTHGSVSLIDTPTPDHASVRFADASHGSTGLVDQPVDHQPVQLHDTPGNHGTTDMVPSDHEGTDLVGTDDTPSHEGTELIPDDQSVDHDPTPMTDTSDHQPVDMAGQTQDWSELSHAARFVEPGEGGFQTLKEMGVPADKWESIWKDAGQRLHGHGKTYLMDDGKWGWDHSMRLNDNDLRIIRAAAARQGVDV